jgi:hypothetical protein
MIESFLGGKNEFPAEKLATFGQEKLWLRSDLNQRLIVLNPFLLALYKDNKVVD